MDVERTVIALGGGAERKKQLVLSGFTMPENWYDTAVAPVLLPEVWLYSIHQR